MPLIIPEQDGGYTARSIARGRLQSFIVILPGVISRITTKPTKWIMRPAKTQLSLGNRPVWSEPSLSAWWKLGPLTTHWAHSEDSDQTGRMPRLMWVFAGRTGHLVGFVTSRLICSLFSLKFGSQIWITTDFKHATINMIQTQCKDQNGSIKAC